MKTITLITADTSTEAHLIKGRLNNEGIECILTNENFTNLMPHYNNVMGAGIQVLIKEEDQERARDIIKDKIEPETIRECPYCHSKHIILGIGKFKGMRFLNMLIAILFLIPLGNLKPKFYCKDCKQEFQ